MRYSIQFLLVVHITFLLSFGVCAEEPQETSNEGRIHIHIFYPENWDETKKLDFERSITQYREKCYQFFADDSCRMRFTIDREQMEKLFLGLKESSGVAFRDSISERSETKFFGQPNPSAPTLELDWWLPSECDEKSFLGWSEIKPAGVQGPSQSVMVQVSGVETDNEVERCEVFVAYVSE